MLQDTDRQLLTACVDGELSARQSRQLEQLLSRSEEAQRFLHRLQQDARELQALVPPALGVDLSGPILQAIGQHQPQPTLLRLPQRIQSWRAWVGSAAAAAVLLAVGSVSYLVFARAFQTDSNKALVKRDAGRPGALPEGQNQTRGPEPEGDQAIARRAAQGTPNKREADTPALDPVVEGPNAAATPDMEADPGSPRDHAGPVLTDRGMEIFQIKTVEAAPPLIVSLQDLGQESTRQRLLAELGKSTAFRLELPVPDATRALEHIHNSWKAPQVNLVLEGLAEGRLKKPQWKTNYVLVGENLTPADLVALLSQLAVKPTGKKAGENLFDRLVASRLARGDRRELTDLLGMDLAPLPASASTGPLGIDLHKPLAEQTAGQLAQAPPRPKAGEAPRKSADQAFLALTLNPRPPRSSAEIKRFLAARKPGKPGTLQVMLVLRNVG